MAWRARVIYDVDTVRFLGRLGATTAMTELIANEWLEARGTEARLLSSLIQGSPGQESGRHNSGPRLDRLRLGAAALTATSGLRGAWLANSDGTLIAGNGVRSRQADAIADAIASAPDSVQAWSEPHPGGSGLIVTVVKALVERSGTEDRSMRDALVLVYDPAVSLLPRLLDVPVPSQTARSRIYAPRGDTLVELTATGVRRSWALAIDSAPPSLSRALAGEESLGPDVTVEGELAHASTRYLERFGWLLVRTIDRQETFDLAFWPRFRLEVTALLVVLTGIGVGIVAHRRALARAELEAALARSELQSLQLQLQPHFLINALAGVAAIVHRAPEGAAELLHRIAEFLRTTLRTIGEQQVSLQRELELLDEYLAIERFRLGESLRVEVQVTEDARRATVPTLVLQPLAENVIRHGYRGPDSVTTLQIVAERLEDVLVVWLRDDGRGFTAPSPRIGLSNTRARLAQLYGSSATCAVRARVTGGTEVELRLPFQQQEPQAISVEDPWQRQADRASA